MPKSVSEVRLLAAMLRAEWVRIRAAGRDRAPKFVPSPEALRAMPGTDWKAPAARLLEFYTMPLQPSNAPTK